MMVMPSAKSKTLPATLNRAGEGNFRQLLRTFGLLERVMQSHFHRFGISAAQWGVLRNLHRAEEEGLPGLRLTDLSDRLLVRPPSVTGAVDRLERAGLVERRGSPTDLRAKQVGLTPKGRQLVEHVLVFHGAQIDAVLGGLTPAEQAEFHRLLGRLGQHLERLLEQGPVAHIG
jgi:DNA-binding MarR family transcriptional regulator